MINLDNPKIKESLSNNNLTKVDKEFSKSIIFCRQFLYLRHHCFVISIDQSYCQYFS